MHGLFDGFDPADVAAAQAARAAELASLGQSRALRRQHRVRTRRVGADAELATLLPARIEPGDSWHILSTGDIDVLSFTRHLLSGHAPFDRLLMSTWRINNDDLEQIEQWLDAGLIERFDLLIDNRFARLAPDEYALAKRLADDYGGSVTLCLNHSKLALMCCELTQTWLVVESSANVNTNHRLEQTAIHHSAELFNFYREAIDGIRTRRAAKS